MKLNRFFALVLTLCMLFSLAQFPVSAEEICFEASGSLSSAAVPLYTYSSQEEINLEEYYIKDVALPSSPTIKSTEYYANSLTADQKQYYRAIMDGFTGISDSSLRLKQAVCVTYSKKYSVTISTQAQLQVFLNNKLNTEMNGLDIQTIYNAIQYDHTELFWMRGILCTVAADASADGTSITVNYYVYFLVDSSDLFASDSALRTAAKAMTSQVSSIISNTPATSEYDKLLHFNKWLKENNTYNNTHLENNNYPLAHTAYSAFTSNSDEPTGPVCQGYAYALKYLCDKAGIHSVIVTGDLCQTGAAPGPHAWNAVELDGNWYAIDTTANDSLGTDVYNFLAGSSTPSHDPGYPTFSSSHVVDDIHTYPTLSTTAYVPACYHSYDNDCDAECNGCGAVRDVPAHVYENDVDLICNECGEERTLVHHVLIEEGQTIEFNLGVGMQNDVSMGLTISDTANLLSFSPYTIGDYNVVSFTATAPEGFGGRYAQLVITSNADGSVLLKRMILIAEKTVCDHVYDDDNDPICNECGEEREIVIVRLPGDVNGDDIVNNKDFGILRQYLNNWEVTINESNADVNADGIVNNKDMGILRQYLNNWDVELL